MIDRDLYVLDSTESLRAKGKISMINLGPHKVFIDSCVDAEISVFE